jgi:hypothetical protein
MRETAPQGLELDAPGDTIQAVRVDDETTKRSRKAAWPRYVLAGLVLFVILNVLWLSHEVRRIQRARAAWSEPTNVPAPASRPLK